MEDHILPKTPAAINNRPVYARRDLTHSLWIWVFVKIKTRSRSETIILDMKILFRLIN
jgi:hypothetical protein